MSHRVAFLIVIWCICFSFASCKEKYGPGPECERNKNRVVAEYGEKIGKKYDMNLIRFRQVIRGTEISEKYGMSFISHKKITLEEGRVFALSLFNDFSQMLETNPVIQTYIEEFTKIIKTSPCDASQKTISLKITYWDEQMDRRFPPYLAAIIFSEGKFNYYEADPKTQELHLVLSESYDDLAHG